jgi:hypothetical protein
MRRTPWRELPIFAVQFGIGWELAGMTMQAQVVGARHFHHAHHGQDRLGAQFPVMRWVATRTSDDPLVGRRGWELEQFGQNRCPSLVHGGAHQHLGGLQFQVSCLAAAVENDTQQLVYFARDFLLDGFRRFFSSGAIASATGRAQASRRNHLRGY